MGNFYLSWGVSAIILLIIAGWAGRQACFSALGKPTVWGILIDSRERFSLTRFQLIMWSLLILSTFLGPIIFNLDSDPGKAMSIPEELLGLLGISAGSAILSGAVKDNKDATRPEKIAGGEEFFRRPQVSERAKGKAVAVTPQEPRFVQVFLDEEGSQGDSKFVSVTKFQSFMITMALGIIYIVLAVKAQGYPVLDDKILWFIGISHAGYIGGKIPNKE